MTHRLNLVFLVTVFFGIRDGLAGLPPEVRTYTADRTFNPPTIDGVISPEEWDTSQDTGDWRLLRDPSASVDFENNRFQIMWDNDFLYFMTTSEYGFWDQSRAETGGDNPDSMDFERDNVSLYLDPNLDGNENTANSDGYQIAWNQYKGEYSCSPCTDPNNRQAGEPGSGWGFFTEAHIGGLFGNQARWVGLPNTVGAMKNDSSGGVTELAIPWTDLNAPGTEDNPDTPDVDETNTSLDITLGGTDPGTPHVDQWFFNVARISSDTENQLPAYNWTTGNFFAAHPHAEMLFTHGHPSAGDFNRDGVIDGDDFLLWQAGFGIETGATRAQGDADGDGDVDGDDFLIWQADFSGNSSAGHSTVPEPSSFLLMIVVIASRGGRRQRTAR